MKRMMTMLLVAVVMSAAALGTISCTKKMMADDNTMEKDKMADDKMMDKK